MVNAKAHRNKSRNERRKDGHRRNNSDDLQVILMTAKVSLFNLNKQNKVAKYGLFLE